MTIAERLSEALEVLRLQPGTLINRAVIHELEIIQDDLERLENKALPFGERLKRIMEKAGYTPESLGKKTGLASTTIRRYLRGVHKPISSALQRLEAVLGKI